MGTPKIVEVFDGYRGDVVVCTEVDGARYSWTVTGETIFGGGVIFEGTETENHNVYRWQGDHWLFHTAETGLQKVSDEIAAHLILLSRQ